jgi:hypothetical protein
VNLFRFHRAAEAQDASGCPVSVNECGLPSGHYNAILLITGHHDCKKKYENCRSWSAVARHRFAYVDRDQVGNAIVRSPQLCEKSLKNV